MRRALTLLTLLALAPTPARAQSEQSPPQPRALAPVYYPPPPVYEAPPAVRAAPAPLVYAQPRAISPAAAAFAVQWAEPLLGRLGRHLAEKHPARPRLVALPEGDGAVQVGYQSSRLVAAPPAQDLVLVPRYAPAYEAPAEPRGLIPPPKAPTPRAAPQAPGKEAGGIDPAPSGTEAEILAELRALRTGQEKLDQRIAELEILAGDRVVAPPQAAPGKGE